MSKAPILSLFAAALIIGWYAPTLTTDLAAEDTIGDTTVAPEETRLAAARQPTWATDGTTLARSGDGHFYAEVTVDAMRYRFLVDTGASVVALTGQDAADMGLQWSEAELQPIGRGANGMVYGVPAMIERMEVDGIEARNVQAAIIPEGLDISLLGQSFLSRIDRVAIEGDTMTLGS